MSRGFGDSAYVVEGALEARPGGLDVPAFPVAVSQLVPGPHEGRVELDGAGEQLLGLGVVLGVDVEGATPAEQRLRLQLRVGRDLRLVGF